MAPPEEEQKEEELDESEFPEPPEVTVAPPRPDIRIVDFSEKKINQYCSVCGLKKERYVEVEVKDSIEYTCKECYLRLKGVQVTSIEPSTMACRKCGAPMLAGDNFCGKCGNPAIMRCSKCNGEIDEEDKFCAKCGTKLFEKE